MTDFSDPLYADAFHAQMPPDQLSPAQMSPADDRLFVLSGEVGAGCANRPSDVFKLQTLLQREGYLDTAEGWGGDWSNRDDYALRRYQRDNGLSIDGLVAPDGETIAAFRSACGLPLHHARAA